MRNNPYPSPVRRRLFHPLTSLILLALLLADSWLIAQPQLLRGYSTAGSFIRNHLLRLNLPTIQPPAPPAALFIRDPAHPGDFRILRPDEESWDQATRDLRDHPRDCLMVRWRAIAFHDGFWAPTAGLDKHIIELTFGENLSDAERASARRQFVEQSGAAQRLSRADFQTLTTTDIDRTSSLWLGYLHNAAAIAAALLFLASLRWVPQTPAHIRSRLHSKRLSEGLCPRCSYNLHGLREPKCPECGAALPTEPRPSGSGHLTST